MEYEHSMFVERHTCINKKLLFIGSSKSKLKNHSYSKYFYTNDYVYY